MNRKLIFLSAGVLITLTALALFFTLAFNGTPVSIPRQFYVGVEYAYGNDTQTAQEQLSRLQALVDKVKDYTNLIVIGSLGLTFNQTALSQACDYIYNANLSIIVLFTGLEFYEVPHLSPALAYNTTMWMLEAQQKYGEKFLGIWRYDEPGGRTLDQGIDPIVYKANVSKEASYADVGNIYFANLHIFPNYYLFFSPKVFSADFGLYWFDYQAGYSSIFAEFVGNESRERHIALCRGAADTFGKDWGVVITWKYSRDILTPTGPYLENGTELYNDLVTAYNAGAKYSIVFSYPQVTSYGTLTEEHFEALRRFWSEIQTGQLSASTLSKPEVAYVVPEAYGFGFRSPNDTIWGVFSQDIEYNSSAKIYSDTNEVLPRLYGARFNILYEQLPLTPELLQSYSKVYYWNQTIP